jgi:hypothetical protein
MSAALALFLLTALSEGKVAVLAAPFTNDDAHAPALTSAVDGALHAAAQMHGMRAARADSIFGVKDQLAACRDDACRAKVAARVGARFVLVGAVKGDELRLRIVDAQGTRIAGMAVAGRGPALVSQVPALVDALVGLAATPVTAGAAVAMGEGPEPMFDPAGPRWDADAGEWFLP